MKAIAYQKFGDTNVLQTVEEAKPTAKPDEILIKVSAVSLNPMDWKIRKGEMKLMSGSKFPRHTGVDFSGVVEETGNSATGFKKGDEVFGIVRNTMKDGALAEYISVPFTSVWKKPASVTSAQAASIPIAGAAAVTAVQKMGTNIIGSEILVNGATGAFGMFLLQLLRGKGATVTAVTSTKGLGHAKNWGADSVIDYSEKNVVDERKTYDIVVDLSGKMGYANAKRIMKKKALFVNPTPKPIEIPAALLKNVFTKQKHVVILSAPSNENMNLLIASVNAGLEIEVNRVFPFSETKQAYEYAERGGVVGKVVVEL